MNNATSPTPPNNSLRELFKLVGLLEQAKLTEQRNSVVVNAFRQLFHADQVILWTNEAYPTSASVISDVDKSSPYLQDLRLFFEQILSKEFAGRIFLDHEIEHISALSGVKNAIYHPLYGSKGGVLVISDQLEYTDAHLQFFNFCIRLISSSFVVGQKKRTRILEYFRFKFSAIIIVCVFLFFLFSLFITVPQNILVPVEIVSTNEVLERAPINGVINAIYVEPGQLVEAGQRLVSFDDTQINAQVEIAHAELSQLRVEYEQETIKLLSEESSRFRLARIQSAILEKNAQLEFLYQQVDDHTLFASNGGIVSIADENQLLGRPVTIGDTIVSISDRFDLAIELWLPLQTALPVAEGDRLRVFLNNTPMAPYSATVDYVTTEPQRRSDGTMGFKGKAHFSDTRGIDIELLGQQGVGRINTGTETLFMKFFRQPLVWLRQSLGI